MGINTAKFWLVGLLAVAAISSSPDVYAGGHGYRNDGYQGYRGHRVDRHVRHKYRHKYRPNYRHSYRYRHRSHSNRGAYLVGGVILGSIITHALTQPRTDYRHTSYSHSRVVRERSSLPAEPARRLFRDRDGNCYERAADSDGSELLIELPPGDCAW